MVYEITPEEANDTNAIFELDNWVKEYSGGSNDVDMNKDGRRTKVAIHDVLAILISNNKTLDNVSVYNDGGVNQNLEVSNLDGVSLPLRYTNDGSKMLEGPIRGRNRGKDVNQKAFV